MEKLIVIAEDEKDLADILSINLNTSGYRTKVFSNGLDLLNCYDAKARWNRDM